MDSFTARKFAQQEGVCAWWLLRLRASLLHFKLLTKSVSVYSSRRDCRKVPLRLRAVSVPPCLFSKCFNWTIYCVQHERCVHESYHVCLLFAYSYWQWQTDMMKFVTICIRYFKKESFILCTPRLNFFCAWTEQGRRTWSAVKVLRLDVHLILYKFNIIIISHKVTVLDTISKLVKVTFYQECFINSLLIPHCICTL